MVFAWFHWWWDSEGLDRAQVVLAVVGTVLATVAVVYAWMVARKQFKLMAEQGKIIDKQLLLMEEQTRAAKRLETMTDEQGLIMKRQGEIAETQHRIMVDQLGRKTALGIILRAAQSTTGEVYYDIKIVNTGNKSANGVYMVLGFEKILQDKISLKLRNPSDTSDEIRYGKPLVMFSLFAREPIYPGGREFVVGELWIQDVSIKPTFELLWKIVGEDGQVPADKIGILTLPDINQ
jgi:hypothetical protein